MISPDYFEVFYDMIENSGLSVQVQIAPA